MCMMVFLVSQILRPASEICYFMFFFLNPTLAYLWYLKILYVNLLNICRGLVKCLLNRLFRTTLQGSCKKTTQTEQFVVCMYCLQLAVSDAPKSLPDKHSIDLKMGYHTDVPLSKRCCNLPPN